MKKGLIFFAIVLLFLAALPTSAQEDATDEANSIRETVRQKILSASNKPVAYIGSITDIVENTIQLENSEGEIQQVSFDEEDTIFIQLNSTSKEIGFEDVGIADYIVAMGYVDNSDVLSASRVLVTSPITQVDRKIIFGNVTSIEGKEVGIKEKDKGETFVVFPRRWKGPEIEDLDVGSEVIVVFTHNEDNELEVRTLEIVETEASEE